VVSGLKHLAGFSAGSAALAAKGFPLPGLAMGIAIALMVIGGLCVASGFHARLGAALLAVFLVVATPTFHAFWAHQGAEAEQQAIHFMKNLAMLGGALVVLACPGRRPGGAG
jgi:putative oxidoreductase